MRKGCTACPWHAFDKTRNGRHYSYTHSLPPCHQRARRHGGAEQWLSNGWSPSAFPIPRARPRDCIRHIDDRRSSRRSWPPSAQAQQHATCYLHGALGRKDVHIQCDTHACWLPCVREGTPPSAVTKRRPRVLRDDRAPLSARACSHQHVRWRRGSSLQMLACDRGHGCLSAATPLDPLDMTNTRASMVSCEILDP